MIGRKRLDNVQYCIEEIIKSGIPGDLIETGIWRGGTTIFMRGVLAAYSITDRRVLGRQIRSKASHRRLTRRTRALTLARNCCPCLP